MKRSLAILLAALMLTSSLTACGSPESEENAAEANPSEAPAEEAAESGEPEEDYLTSLGKKNFGGAEYSVMVLPQDPPLLHPATFEVTGETVNDAKYERDRKIENDYGVVIAYPECEASDQTALRLINSVSAGDHICDVYIDCLTESASHLGAAFRQKVLKNLLEIPYLQLDQNWWSSLMYDTMVFNNKMFFTSGDMACYTYAAPACTYMNLQTAENHAISADDVYQLVYNGEWTIDEMMTRTEGLRADVNGDGKVRAKYDNFGVVNAQIQLTAVEILVGAGVKMSETDADGNLIVKLNTENTLNALEKIRKCFTEAEPNDNLDLLLFDTFVTDRTLFCVHFTVDAFMPIFREMESDYSILPMPKGSVEQESYMSYINPFTHSFIALPLTSGDPEMVGFITEVMEYLTVQDVRPTIYDVTLKGKAARNPDTQAMLDIVFNTTYTDLNAVMNLGSSVSQVSGAAFKDTNFASSFAGIEKILGSSIQEVMDELFADS